MADNAVYADYRHLDIAVGDGIAVVTIPVAGSVGGCRPASIGRSAASGRTLGEDDDVRVVVVTGTGPDFYQSADAGGLKAIPAIPKEEAFDLLQRMLGRGADIVYGMVDLDKPIVAAINGTAAGGGLAVALLADISIAAEDAQLVDPHVALGLAAGDHATMVWPLLCGMAKSKLVPAHLRPR